MVQTFKPEKFYRVSEILQFMRDQKMPISRQTLHNYTLMELIQESKRTLAGHRLYNEDVFKHLLQIETLKRHHTLREVKKLISKKNK